MIKNTFSILQGIGEKLEKRLWKNGILTWEGFLDADSIDFLSWERKRLHDATLKETSQNLQDKNPCYFYQLLRHCEHWRLFQEFRDEAVALDIETSGYPVCAGGYVTVVGLYDGFDYKSFVRGNGFDTQALIQELNRYKYLITFFGSGFDLPFLREALGITITLPHFDLCFGARKIGLKGGLKKIEDVLGIHRDESIKGFDGFDAVRLWNEARRGNREAYELLITYNRYDTVNLFHLADIVYENLRIRTGIDSFYL